MRNWQCAAKQLRRQRDVAKVATDAFANRTLRLSCTLWRTVTQRWQRNRRSLGEHLKRSASSRSHCSLLAWRFVAARSQHQRLVLHKFNRNRQHQLALDLLLRWQMAIKLQLQRQNVFGKLLDRLALNRKAAAILQMRTLLLARYLQDKRVVGALQDWLDFMKQKQRQRLLCCLSTKRWKQSLAASFMQAWQQRCQTLLLARRTVEVSLQPQAREQAKLRQSMSALCSWVRFLTHCRIKKLRNSTAQGFLLRNLAGVATLAWRLCLFRNRRNRRKTGELVPVCFVAWHVWHRRRMDTRHRVLRLRLTLTRSRAVRAWRRSQASATRLQILRQRARSMFGQSALRSAVDAWCCYHKQACRKRQSLATFAALRHWRCWLKCRLLLKDNIQQAFATAAAHDAQRLSTAMFCWWRWQITWASANIEASAKLVWERRRSREQLERLRRCVAGPNHEELKLLQVAFSAWQTHHVMRDRLFLRTSRQYARFCFALLFLALGTWVDAALPPLRAENLRRRRHVRHTSRAAIPQPGRQRQKPFVASHQQAVPSRPPRTLSRGSARAGSMAASIGGGPQASKTSTSIKSEAFATPDVRGSGRWAYEAPAFALEPSLCSALTCASRADDEAEVKLDSPMWSRRTSAPVQTALELSPSGKFRRQQDQLQTQEATYSPPQQAHSQLNLKLLAAARSVNSGGQDKIIETSPVYGRGSPLGYTKRCIVLEPSTSATLIADCWQRTPSSASRGRESTGGTATPAPCETPPGRRSAEPGSLRCFAAASVPRTADGDESPRLLRALTSEVSMQKLLEVPSGTGGHTVALPHTEIQEPITWQSLTGSGGSSNCGCHNDCPDSRLAAPGRATSKKGDILRFFKMTR